MTCCAFAADHTPPHTQHTHNTHNTHNTHTTHTQHTTHHAHTTHTPATTHQPPPSAHYPYSQTSTSPPSAHQRTVWTVVAHGAQGPRDVVRGAGHHSTAQAVVPSATGPRGKDIAHAPTVLSRRTHAALGHVREPGDVGVAARGARALGAVPSARGAHEARGARYGHHRTRLAVGPRGTGGAVRGPSGRLVPPCWAGDGGPRA
jgi:hypothetical protein